MRLPAGPARFLKTRYIVAALFAAFLAVASITGFVWATKSVTLVVDGTSKSVATESNDVASLLAEAGVDTRQGDLVSPEPSAPVSDGDVVVVRHAIPVTLRLGPDTISLKVLGRTVADALVMAGLDPTSGMRTDPAVDAELTPGMTITATDVFMRVLEEQVTVPFGTVINGDPSLPSGVRKVVTPGAAGSAIRVWQVVVTGGIEGQRTLKLERSLVPAVDEVVAVGTKTPFHQVVAARQVSAPQHHAPRIVPAPAIKGRSLRVESTAYTPYECGQSVAWVARKKAALHIPEGWGIVAVDPRVIPLGSKLFVEGYGYAVACDTGGAIKGMIIDVCFWGGDLMAPTDSSTGSQRQAAHNACERWGRRHGVRITILGH